MRIPNDDPAKVRRCNEDNYCDEITSDFRARARTLKGKLGRNGTFKRPTAFCKFNVHAADPMSGPRIRKLLVSFSAAFRPSLKSDCLPVLPFCNAQSGPSNNVSFTVVSCTVSSVDGGAARTLGVYGSRRKILPPRVCKRVGRGRFGIEGASPAPSPLCAFTALRRNKRLVSGLSGS